MTEPARPAPAGRPRRPRRPLDLCDVGTARAVARRAGLSLQHRLGQNLIVDRAVLDAIMGALALEAHEEVFEIGMGIGTLTAELAHGARRVVAVEIDPACCRAARITLREAANVEIVEGDALGCDRRALGLQPGWVAAGNIPYHMTGVLLSSLFEDAQPPTRGVFLVQREVAQRLAAPAGAWSLATVAIRSIATVEQLMDVAPASFHPEPHVHSSVIRLRPSAQLPMEERSRVLGLARAAFQLRRKTFRHGLTRALNGDAAASARVLAETGIDPGRRPGTLTIEEWRTVAVAAAGEVS